MGLSPGVLFFLPKLRPTHLSPLQPRLQSQNGTEMHEIGVILDQLRGIRPTKTRPRQNLRGCFELVGYPIFPTSMVFADGVGFGVLAQNSFLVENDEFHGNPRNQLN